MVSLADRDSVFGSVSLGCRARDRQVVDRFLPIYPIVFLLRECLLRNVNTAAIKPKLMEESWILHEGGQDCFYSADISI
jgi:hypothetical protein